MKPESEYVFHDVRRTHFGTNDGVYWFIKMRGILNFNF
jgi:hypothetical protein